MLVGQSGRRSKRAHLHTEDPEYLGGVQNLYLYILQGGLRSQNPERRRSGSYRDASTTQGGRSVLPAPLSMTEDLRRTSVRPLDAAPFGRAQGRFYGSAGAGCCFLFRRVTRRPPASRAG